MGGPGRAIQRRISRTQAGNLSINAVVKAESALQKIEELRNELVREGVLKPKDQRTPGGVVLPHVMEQGRMVK